MVFTIVDKDNKEITYNLGQAIPLIPLDGSALFFPYKDIFRYIYREVVKVFEIYEDFSITNVYLRVFLTGPNVEKHLSTDEVIKVLDTLFEDLSHDYDYEYKDDGYVKRLLLFKGITPFMVADIETILISDDKGLEVQTPYAAGLLVVPPEKVLDKVDIMNFYSEGSIYQKKNHRIYEIKVYNNMQHVVDEKMVAKKCVLLFTFKDSLNLLPGKLATLAQNLCPNLGDKYDINHEQLKTVEDISLREKELLERGYYGGHVDVYKSYGENLFYYDVNFLYPYVMQKEPMPAGKPVWNTDLKNNDLGTLYGFIEAYVECLDSLNKPFLPYRDLETGSLLFSIGYFVGVYYNEELKYARTLGYKVYTLRGYLFKKAESPFKTFVNDIYNSRFGINPKMTITEICDQDHYNQILRMDAFINGDTLNEDTHVVNFIKDLSTDGWEPPKNAAVQITAVITACARIYMYPHISREDCYYTDIDSIVLGNPLSDEWISSSVLGKFKLEDQIASGVFLAPKSYCYITIDGEDVVKKTTNLAMNVEPGAKRQAVYTEKNVWLDTKPKKVDDLKDCTNQDLKYIIQILFKNSDSNESLNTTLETYQSDVDREPDRSGIHSDGYGSESYDNSSGSDSDSGSDNKNEIIPPIDDKEDETTNTSDNHSSTSSGWDKVVTELRRE
ncbi:hypothetical protein AgCh_004100 [Apium graveolens]